MPAQGAEVGVLGLRLADTQDPAAVWPFYFTSISAAGYPAAIEAAVQEIGSAGEYAGVNFSGDLDEGDLAERGPIPPDMVEVYHQHFGEIRIPRASFYAILLAFGERLVARPGQPRAWTAAMQAALARLHTKLADAAG